MPTPSHIVGRHREQTLLHDLLAEARAGRGGLVLVAGEAGVGKTALVDWLGEHALARGASLMRGGCYDLSVTPPYGPWIEALSQSSTAHPLGSTDGDPEGNQTLLFARVHDHLASLAARQPLVLVLEDLHWSDPAGLGLLRAVARGLEALPVLLAATYRVDALEQRSPLASLLPLLVRESRATRIDLSGLRRDDVLALVHARYTVAPADGARLASYLHERSGGNPFFLNEMLRTLENEGLLIQTSDGWSIGDLASAPIPPLVRQVIENRLGSMEADTRTLLEVAAVIGQDVPLDLLRAAIGEERASPDRAVRAQFLVESPQHTSLSFTHALVRETLYVLQPAEKRRQVHLRVAELLSEDPKPPAQRIASHFAAADDPRAIDWLVRAGERALALYAARDAVVALNSAQAIAARHRRDLPRSAYRARAAAHALLGEFDLARGDRETVLERARAEGDRPAEWQALVDLGLHWAERDYERTGAYYRAALELAHALGDQVLIAHSLNRIANQHSNLDEPEMALPLHIKALAIFEARRDHAGLAETLDFLGMTSYLACDYTAALRYLERALALYRAMDDRRGMYACLVTMQLLGGEQDFGFAAPVYREADFWRRCGNDALALARDMRWTTGEAFALAMRSFSAGVRGEYGSALTDAETALFLAERAGHRQWAVAARLALGTASLMLFQHERAAALMEHALTDARRIGSVFWVNSVGAALASLWVGQGSLSRASALLDSIVHVERVGVSSGQRQCWYARAELELALRHPERALEIIDILLDSQPPAEHAHGIPALSKLRGDALLQLKRAPEAQRAYLSARASLDTSRSFGGSMLL
ncbi:MAG: hypothetical protein DCC58_17780 [Chloroflexi bacterium]|nr:MAG: hypothetical protein DCC58_17780 [Chloroflexota bacterium]